MSNSHSLSILIIEDNQAVARNLADFLTPLEHQLDFAINGQQGLELALNNHYDVIILDLMLPVLDGISVCQKLREKANRHIPILMLTARDTLDDKLNGFDTGADDYLTKPFALEEMYARLLAISKRFSKTQQREITLGELTIIPSQQQVFRQQQAISLQPIPFQILSLLAENHPRVVSRSELWNKIWHDDFTDSDVIRSHIYQLRQALDKPFDKPLLATVHGVGFKLNV